jgi:hypothetical protein
MAFIRLNRTARHQPSPVRINVNTIKLYYDGASGSTTVEFVDGNSLTVSESPDAVDALIAEARLRAPT